MKHSKSLLMGTVAALVGMLLLVDNAQATSEQARREALGIALVAAAAGYQIDGGVASQYLKLGEIGGGRAVLQRGRDYKIIVGGCNDARDLDLVVLDENDNLVGQDVDYAKHGVVDVSPGRTGNYSILIKMTNGTPDGAHFALVVASN